jgi:hypothetical protein
MREAAGEDSTMARRVERSEAERHVIKGVANLGRLILGCQIWFYRAFFLLRGSFSASFSESYEGSIPHRSFIIRLSNSRFPISRVR